MIRATLDVNVLASGFSAEIGVPATLIDHWTDFAYEMVISDHMLEALVRVWQKPYFRRRIGDGRVQQVFASLREQAALVAPVTTVRGVATHAEDDLVLATAIAGNAAFLVTGDKELRALRQYQNVVILFPREFLEVLQHETVRQQ